MKRFALVALAALAGIGAGVALSVTTGARDVADPPRRHPSFAEAPVPLAAGGTVVVWTPGGLPDVADALRSLRRIESVSVVRGDHVELSRSELADGTVVDDPDGPAVIPLDALAVDPDTYPHALPVADAKTVATLRHDEVLLGETSAALRRLQAGDTIILAGGHRYSVAAVVPDQLVAGAEVVFTLEGGEAVGVDTDRYALVTHTSARAHLDTAVREVVPAPVRIRGTGETPFLRHGDAVLTQAEIKEQFGEFSYRRGADGILVLDHEWERNHLVTAKIPVLGRLRCHRGILVALRAAMLDLEAEGLDALIDADAFGGCWSPRFIGPDHGLSRHAWGVAVDLNSRKNPTGLASVLDERVVRTMERHGFTWGGRWLVPDPGHFEYHTPSRRDR